MYRVLTQQLCVDATDSGAISYPNYKFSFTIWALGKAARAFAAPERR